MSDYGAFLNEDNPIDGIWFIEDRSDYAALHSALAETDINAGNNCILQKLWSSDLIRMGLSPLSILQRSGVLDMRWMS